MSAPGPGAAWYLRTGRDLFDAHLAVECPGGSTVRSRCGAEFEPFARFTSGGLPAVQALDDQPAGSPCPRCRQHVTGGPGPEAVPDEGASYFVAALTVIEHLHQLRRALVKAETLADQTAGLTGGQLADQLEPLVQRAGDHVEQATRTLLALLDACIDGLGPCLQHWPTANGPGAP